MAMKRKQKRFLQMTLLFSAALIFLPDIGLWALYKEKHLVKPAEPSEPQVGAAGFFWGGGWERRVAPHGLLVARTERREKVVGEGIRPLASPGWPRCPGTAADCEIGKMRDFGCFGGQPGGCWALGSRGFPDEKWSSCRNFQGSVRR